MTCSQCQAQNPDDARFCEECGARLMLACPQCGAEITPGKKFCRACGAALSGRAPDRPLSPASYTPKHFADSTVTCLRSPSSAALEVRIFLDPVLERMMEAVHRYEGTVNQVMGDGIMALFGAPLAHEDHAVRHWRRCSSHRLPLTATPCRALSPKPRPHADAGPSLRARRLGLLGGAGRTGQTGGAAVAQRGPTLRTMRAVTGPHRIRAPIDAARAMARVSHDASSSSGESPPP